MRLVIIIALAAAASTAAYAAFLPKKDESARFIADVKAVGGSCVTYFDAGLQYYRDRSLNNANDLTKAGDLRQSCLIRLDYLKRTEDFRAEAVSCALRIDDTSAEGSWFKTKMFEQAELINKVKMSLMDFTKADDCQY